jgi:glutaconate CoA-transferase subunit B
LGSDEATMAALLRSYHPGQSPESVRANTGWDLQIAPDVAETPAPSADELAIIRRYDPQGFWTR